MSHVIPLRLFQILNSRRWNCNVFGWSRKMTALNYVRDLSGPGLPPSGAVAWPAGDTTPIRPARPLACLQSLSKRLHRGCPKMLHVIPLRLFQILNSRRWNCNVFGWSRKMTEGNYVRNLAGGGVVAAHGHRSQARVFRARPCPPALPALPGSATSLVGVCCIRSWLSACRRRVVPLMMPFPPFGGGDAGT